MPHAGEFSRGELTVVDGIAATAAKLSLHRSAYRRRYVTAGTECPMRKAIQTCYTGTPLS